MEQPSPRIRTVLTLRTVPENVGAIVELFRTEGILQESLDLTRALSSEISVATDGTGEIMVTALWPDDAGYQEWLDHPNRGRIAPQLEALLEGAEVGVGKTYRVDHAVTKA